MGAEKRRRQAGNYPKTAKIEIRDPTDHPHLPGTLTVQILHDSGASLSGSVPLGDIDIAIQIGETAAKELGGTRDDLRTQARSWIDSVLRKGEHLTDETTGNAVVATAMWLAHTAPEPYGGQIREHLREGDVELVLAITTHMIHGRRAINGRTLMFPADTELAEILQASGMGPSTEFMTHKLAPH